MTGEDIIRMAEECGIPEFENNESQADNIIRFAELVAAAERNRTWTQDHWTEYERSIAAAAKAEEREACAKVCDSISEDQWALYKGRPPYTGKELERASDYTQGKSDGAEVCAAAIRARGQA